MLDIPANEGRDQKDRQLGQFVGAIMEKKKRKLEWHRYTKKGRQRERLLASFYICLLIFKGEIRSIVLVAVRRLAFSVWCDVLRRPGSTTRPPVRTCCSVHIDAANFGAPPP